MPLISEGDGIEYIEKKEKVRKEEYRCMSLVLNNESNSQDRRSAINNLAVPGFNRDSISLIET